MDNLLIEAGKRSSFQLVLVQGRLWIPILAALISAVALLYGLSPTFDREATARSVESSETFRTFADKLRSEALKAGEDREGTLEADQTLFTKVQIRMLAEFANLSGTGGHVKTATSASVVVRYDRIFLFLGTAAIFVFTAFALFPARTVQISPHIYNPAFVGYPDLKSSTESEGPKAPPSATDVLQSEVVATGKRAEELFSRSTLLLAGGVIMAFIGVGIFYVTLPDATAIAYKDDTGMIWAYLRTALRPTGVLIFLEAIAWFLLRQYRTLIEDYKWFYRVYVKRANYLAATRLLAEKEVTKEQFFLATCLVNEDLSGLLKSGETTESLERLRMPEDSPVKEILSAIEAMYKDTKDKAPKVRVAARQDSTDNKS